MNKREREKVQKRVTLTEEKSFMPAIIQIASCSFLNNTYLLNKSLQCNCNEILLKSTLNFHLTKQQFSEPIQQFSESIQTIQHTILTIHECTPYWLYTGSKRNMLFTL